MVDTQSISAEMARVNVTQVEKAKRLNISDRSFSLKINGFR